MVHFVGAGPGAEDLITLRGLRLLQQADVIVYAGSLVNPELLRNARKGARIYNSAKMALEQVLEVFLRAKEQGLDVVRLHTGDPSLYGAIGEQIQALEKLGIGYDVTPGVSSLFGASACLGLEYTLPGLSQSLIITRMEGRTPVPEGESIEAFASHQSTMAIFLSTGMLGPLSEQLKRGGYPGNTPAAIVYKATWPEERVVSCTVDTLEESAQREGIKNTALILVGQVLRRQGFERSKLYDPGFTTGFRRGRGEDG